MALIANLTRRFHHDHEPDDEEKTLTSWSSDGRRPLFIIVRLVEEAYNATSSSKELLSLSIVRQIYIGSIGLMRSR